MDVLRRGVLCVLALIAAGLASTACSSAYDAACTAIGAADGVLVHAGDVAIPKAAELSLTACLEGQCRTQTFRGPHLDRLADDGLFVGVPRVPVDAGVKISVRLAADSRRFFAGSTVAHTHKFQPNGPHCEPTVWRALVVAHDSTRLTSE